MFSTLPKNTFDDDAVLTVPNTFNCPPPLTCNVPPNVELPVTVAVLEIIVPVVSKLPTDMLPTTFALPNTCRFPPTSN